MSISARSRRQCIGYRRTWLKRKLLLLHHLIILLKLLTEKICFSLQGFLSEKMRKINSYLTLENGKVLVQGVKPVPSWSSTELNLCIVLPITNRKQFSENVLCILQPCLTSVIRPEIHFFRLLGLT